MVYLVHRESEVVCYSILRVPSFGIIARARLGSYYAPVICIHGPSGPGISGAFNFSIFKAPLKALHSGAKIVVKSLLKAPGTDVMKNNKWPELFELTFLAYFIVIPHKLWLHWSCSFRENFEHTHIHRHIHTFTRQPSVLKTMYMYMSVHSCLPNTTAESCSR